MKTIERGGGSAAPDMSVVMAVFNDERYLPQAVESILGQTFGDFEFLIVDDGSTDGTPAILEEYRRADRRVRVMRQPNAGQAVALNRGCSLARGTYVARIDGDDASMKDRLSLQIEFLRRNGHVGLLGGAVDLIDSKGRRFDRDGCPLDDSDIRRALDQGCCFYHSAVMFRTDAWRVAGGYRKAFLYAEDYDLWLRMAERYQVANLPDALTSRRIHGQQVSARHLRQHVTSALGARRAAWMRRETGSDPFWNVDTATAELLKGHGVSEEEIDRHIRATAMGWIRLLLRAGQERDAVVLFREMRGAADPGEGERSVLGALYWDQAREYRWEGKLGASLAWTAKAIRKRPGLAAAASVSIARAIPEAGEGVVSRLLGNGTK